MPERSVTINPTNLFKEVLRRGYRHQVDKVIPDLGNSLNRAREILQGSNLTVDSGLPLIDSYINRISSVRKEFDRSEDLLSSLQNLVSINIESVLFPDNRTKPVDRLVHLGRAIVKGINDLVNDPMICKQLLIQWNPSAVYRDPDPFGTVLMQVDKDFNQLSPNITSLHYAGRLSLPKSPLLDSKESAKEILQDCMLLSKGKGFTTSTQILEGAFED